MLRIDRTESEMIDKLILFRQPLRPAFLTGFFVNFLTQRVAERSRLHPRHFIPTTGTINRRHYLPQKLTLRERSNILAQGLPRQNMRGAGKYPEAGFTHLRVL